MVVKRKRTPLSAQLPARRRVMVARLARRWWAVMRHPGVRAFEQQQEAANWPDVWLGISLLAVIEALGFAYLVYGPGYTAGYSSLPIGPTVHLPQTLLLPLAALLGSIAQFFGFAGLLHLSARMVGGKSAFLRHAYLLSLGWVPLMGLSDLVEMVPVVGSWLGVLLRLYALYVCVCALAAAQWLTLARAWTALLVLVLAGLLLGLVALVLLRPILAQVMV